MSRRETRRFLVKTILTGENGEQWVDHRLYKVLINKTDQTFKKEFTGYLSSKYPKCMFSVNIYDYEKPVPRDALPDDEEAELFCFPW